MLVFRRRTGESFLIGDNIEVEVLEIENGQVKLGIRAPREITVLRKEIAANRDANLASARPVGEQPIEDAVARLRGRWAKPPVGDGD
jgi:carbon storage regulator